MIRNKIAYVEIKFIYNIYDINKSAILLKV